MPFLASLLLASIAMGGALWWLGNRLDAQLLGDLWSRILWLGALVAGGGIIYALAILLLGTYRLSELTALLRRQPKKTD